MKLTIAFFILIVFFSSPISAWAKTGNCKLENAITLELSGSTDAKMLACVQSKNLESVKIIKVNSYGGSVDDALQIGALLAPLKAEFIITKQCNSSCANYFLPIARKITLQKNAAIALHGSMDIGFGRKISQDAPDDKKAITVWDIVERQQIYAAKYNIHRGWLLYRDSYEHGGNSQFNYVRGQLA